MLEQYRGRSFLGFSMMVTPAFLCNALSFTYALVLDHSYGVGPSSIGCFFFPFALGDLAGPLLLGRLFDTVGRREMILATYGLSEVLLAISAVFFYAGSPSATTRTVSEIFPLELRGQAISYFFAISLLAGGVGAPSLFGALIGDGTDRGPLTVGYFVGDAEGKGLEDNTDPLSAVEESATSGATRLQGPTPR